jgi:hypothetical protein
MSGGFDLTIESAPPSLSICSAYTGSPVTSARSAPQEQCAILVMVKPPKARLSFAFGCRLRNGTDSSLRQRDGGREDPIGIEAVL